MYAGCHAGLLNQSLYQGWQSEIRRFFFINYQESAISDSDSNSFSIKIFKLGLGPIPDIRLIIHAGYPALTGYPAR